MDSALPILYNTRRLAPHRVERQRGRLRTFEFTMMYQAGKRNPCDYGSRQPDPVPKNLTREQREEMGIETEEEDREIWVNRVTQEMITAITMEDIVDGTINDPELGPILESK